LLFFVGFKHGGHSLSGWVGLLTGGKSAHL
jgi:hypothetical protein